MAGLSLPLLLFADDIVLMGTDRAVVQRQLDTLHAFCEANGLTVSVKKTKWFLGGRVSRVVSSESLLYAGQVLTRVSQFQYLGLVFTP